VVAPSLDRCREAPASPGSSAHEGVRSRRWRPPFAVRPSPVCPSPRSYPLAFPRGREAHSTGWGALSRLAHPTVFCAVLLAIRVGGTSISRRGNRDPDVQRQAHVGGRAPHSLAEREGVVTPRKVPPATMAHGLLPETSRNPSPQAQWIGSWPDPARAALMAVNGRVPRKPRAFSGLGWLASSTTCGAPVTSAALRRAYAPHSANTTRSGRASSARIAASVKCSQPCPACEPAAPARTVITALSSSTPCRAQLVRSPLAGGGTPRSACSSLKMLRSEG